MSPAFQEGKAARFVHGDASLNPYRRFIAEQSAACNDPEAHMSRAYEFARDWDSGFAAGQAKESV